MNPLYTQIQLKKESLLLYHFFKCNFQITGKILILIEITRHSIRTNHQTVSQLVLIIQPMQCKLAYTVHNMTYCTSDCCKHRKLVGVCHSRWKMRNGKFLRMNPNFHGKDLLNGIIFLSQKIVKWIYISKKTPKNVSTFFLLKCQKWVQNFRLESHNIVKT